MHFTSYHFLLTCGTTRKIGVMKGPLKFLTARKILPLLNLLAKFTVLLACSCSPNFCVARKVAKQIFYFCSCSQKIAVLVMLANARKDHSTPLKMLALVNKLLLCVKEGIAFSSIRSYGHLKGIGVQKDATYFHPLKFAVHYDLSILIHSTLALEYFASRKTIFFLINDTSSSEE